MLAPTSLVSLILPTILLGASALLTKLLLRQVSSGKAKVYDSVPRHSQWDHVFGLDLVFSQLRALREDRFLEWLDERHAGMPKTFALTFLGTRQIFTIDVDNLRAMSMLQWREFGMAPIRRYRKAGMPFADKGISTSDGEDWVFSRQLLKPLLNPEAYTDTRRVRPFLEKLLAVLPAADGETVDLQPLLQRWFLDVGTDLIFGEAIDSLSHPERAAITWAFRDVLQGARIKLQFIRFAWLMRWDWWLKAVAVVHDYVNGHIRKTYKQLEERESRVEAGLPVEPERTDLLWHMANRLRDEELLRSEVCLLFLMNIDTTAIWASNALWHLARNPASWGRCREEALACAEEDLTFETLKKMDFIRAVLKETHRLNPVNVLQVRACLKDTTLPRGGGPDGQSPILVREGDVVQVSKPVMYRDKDYWGPDADDFKPERWEGRKGGSWHFTPFGGGPRRCPAQVMATTDATFLIARIAQTYRRIEPRDDAPYRAVMRIGPSNKTGVQVALYK